MGHTFSLFSTRLVSTRYEQLGVKVKKEREESLNVAIMSTQQWSEDRDRLVASCRGNPDLSALPELLPLAESLEVSGKDKKKVVVSEQEQTMVGSLSRWLKAWKGPAEELTRALEGVRQYGITTSPEGAGQGLSTELERRLWVARVVMYRKTQAVSKSGVEALERESGASMDEVNYLEILEGLDDLDAIETKGQNIIGGIITQQGDHVWKELSDRINSFLSVKHLKDRNASLPHLEGEDSSSRNGNGVVCRAGSSSLTVEQQIMLLEHMKKLLDASYLSLPQAQQKVCGFLSDLRMYKDAWDTVHGNQLAPLRHVEAIALQSFSTEVVDEEMSKRLKEAARQKAAGAKQILQRYLLWHSVSLISVQSS